jgi:putative SOS response-associated peptidase YedK
MCYDVKSQLTAALKRARHLQDMEEARRLEEALHHYEGQVLFHHVSGFDHPKLVVFTGQEPFVPKLFTWGLVPSWVKDRDQAAKLWNQTLNARGETIFDKPAFRGSARNKRCVVYLDGFYEHHHANKRTYPHFIRLKDGEPFAVAGLWEEWVDRNTGEVLRTFAIVTSPANELMARIHNNPKLEEGPRMPLILPDELVDQWLRPVQDELDEQRIKELVKPYPAEEMMAHTVCQLRGKQGVGNTAEACAEHVYPELVVK